MTDTPDPVTPSSRPSPRAVVLAILAGLLAVVLALAAGDPKTASERVGMILPLFLLVGTEAPADPTAPVMSAPDPSALADDPGEAAPAAAPAASPSPEVTP